MDSDRQHIDSNSVQIAMGKSNGIFEMVQQIRADLSDQTEHPFDEFSYHYVYVQNGVPIGTLSSQNATEGTIDCETYYPIVLRQRYEPELFSPCKFRIRPGQGPALLALRTLVRSLWIHQLEMGAKIAIINVTTTMCRFYQRIGFSEIPGFEFTHPLLQTHSHVMVMAADPSRRSYCQDLFENIEFPISQNALVGQCIDRQSSDALEISRAA